MGRKIKGALLSVALRLCGHKVGKRLRSECWNPFSSSIGPRHRITIGDDVSIGKNMSIFVRRDAELVLGDRVVLDGDTFIRSTSSIRLGDDSGVAEFCSIRDSNHGMSRDAPIMRQPATRAPIAIGKDVWIGAGCRILQGSAIPDGAVIGANSVVVAKSPLEPYGVHAGVPARFIRSR